MSQLTSAKFQIPAMIGLTVFVLATFSGVYLSLRQYQVNPWLTLRGSTGAYRTVTLAAGAIDWGYSAGAGLDLASSRHVVWSADYLFTHDDSSINGRNDTHAVTVGVTVKK